MRITRVFAVLGAFGAAAAPAAQAQDRLTAPGRVVMPSLGWTVEDTPDAGIRGSLSVQLPDGGALVLADFDGHGRALHHLRRDGTFELRGPLQLPDGARALPAHAMALDARGRVLLALERRRPLPSPEASPMVVVRLTAAGDVDRTFGAEGVADPGINLGCGSCEDITATPDGGIAVTGSLGGTIPTGPQDPGRRDWVVARLTASGARDAAFDGDGIAVLPRQSAAGFNVAALADGRLVVQGQENLAGGTSRILLARLTPAGALDPTYDGDGIAETPLTSGFAWLVGADGSVHLDGVRPTQTTSEIARYTPSGTPDPAFGGDGFASLGGLTVRRLHPDGPGVLIAAQPVGESGTTTAPASSIVLARADAAGTVTTDFKRVAPAFGGGIESGSLAQNSLFIRDVHRRPDGSFLVTGGVGAAIYTGEGSGRSVGGAAFASLTRDLAPDPAFGRAPAVPRLRVALPRQQAAAIRRTRRLRLRLDAPRGSLTEVTVRANGRLLARTTLAALSGGARTREVTVARSRRPRATAGARLTLTARSRDLVRTTVTARARGMRLR